MSPVKMKGEAQVTILINLNIALSYGMKVFGVILLQNYVKAPQ